MKKHLSNSEVKEINLQLHNLYKSENFIDKKDVVILEDEIVKINNKAAFFYYTANNNNNGVEGNTAKIIVPILKMVLENNLDNYFYKNLKKVTVDMGAVKFVVSGADVMRPGIVNFDDRILKEEIVLIVDINHKKPLAVGKMMFSGDEAKALSSGKVVKNVHYVGDGVWKK
ncbi:TPA: hypothetical protein HA246_06605 [Candidatus Woesearchaeota archaeon]|nr:hypothetical protein [Candidatus Woesearchaeota archaeon]